MLEPYVVTLCWGYPYDKAVGAKQTEVSLLEPTTPHMLLSEMVRRYPSLEAALEPNRKGNITAFVCMEKRVLTMQHPIAETCALHIMPPLSGG